MSTENQIIEVEPEANGTREAFARFRSLIRLVLISASIGLLAAFHVPIQLILQISAGVVLLLLLGKFIKDNSRLARKVGPRRLLKAMPISVLVILPFVLPLLPGYWIGAQISNYSNMGISKLQVMSAPDIISEKVKKQFERKVEERIKRNLPWWYAPAVWVGVADDYATQVRIEAEIVIETINHAKPKPMHIRAIAGFLKAALLAIGIYSTAWVVILIGRTYCSLFGRVLVASGPPVIFGSGNPGRLRKKRKDRHLSGPVIESGLQVNLKLQDGEKLYVRRTDLPGNSPPDWKPCWRAGCLFMRLRKGLFSMDLVVGTKEARDYPFRAHSGFQYASIILVEGQEVVVNPVHLSGFSDTILFRSHWDFNIAMLALHHPISLVARGPGRLILKCSGVPTTHQTASGVTGVSMANLMLFGQDARFKIEASRGLLNYFASGCLVRPISGELFITTPGVPGKSSFFRTFWNLIKQVYMPI